MQGLNFSGHNCLRAFLFFPQLTTPNCACCNEKRMKHVLPCHSFRSLIRSFCNAIFVSFPLNVFSYFGEYERFEVPTMFRGQQHSLSICFGSNLMYVLLHNANAHSWRPLCCKSTYLQTFTKSYITRHQKKIPRPAFAATQINAHRMIQYHNILDFPFRK